MLAVRSNHTLRFLEDWSLVQTDPGTMIADLPAETWTPLSAGEGAKGLGSITGRACSQVSGRTGIFPLVSGAAESA